MDTVKKLPGLIGYYPLSELSGNALNYAPATIGTMKGTVTDAVQGASGVVGRAASFDGADDIIRAGNSAALNVTGNISAVAIIKPTGFGELGLGYIASKGNGFTADQLGWGFSLRSNTNQETFRLAANNTTYEAAASAITLNVWQMPALTYDKDAGSNQVKFYVNSVTKGTSTKTGDITSSTEDFTIGSVVSLDRDFAGLIQHVIISNTTFTPGQILRLAKRAGFV